jgi:DEAD/DEAH box helicase domain-containing protein
MHYLVNPDAELWRRWALLRTFAQANLASFKDKIIQNKLLATLQQYIDPVAIAPWQTASIFTGEVEVSQELEIFHCGDLKQHQKLSADGNASLVFIKLNHHSPDAQVKKSWREALRMLNLYQFLDHVYIALENRPILDSLVIYPSSEESGWDTLQELIIDEDVLQQLPKLNESHIPLGEPGYELSDQNGSIVAIAEIAWVSSKIALTTTVEDHQIFLESGWQSWLCDDFFAKLDHISTLIQA